MLQGFEVVLVEIRHATETHNFYLVRVAVGAHI